MNNVHFSSKSNEWTTPQDFFDMLNDEFAFTLDAAATSENAKCVNYYDVETDALSQCWRGTVWLNPPYGRKIGKWIRKAWEESQRGVEVVVLMPVRSDTPYWHDYVMRAAEVRLVRGRLRFSDSSASAPFPCCVVVFRPWCQGPPKFSSIARNPIP